jgi:putative transposase
MNDPLPDEIDEALWDEALLAAELEVSRATAFRLIKLFRNGGTVMSLV